MIKAIITGVLALIVTGTPKTHNTFSEKLQSCSAQLTVEKNRSFKSADENGANFKLTLTNTSGTRSSYKLTTSKLSSPCSNKISENKFSKSTVKNSDLNVSFIASNSKGVSKQNNIITLDAGQSTDFEVNAMAPEGTPYNTWGCIEVKANAIDCKSVSVETILSIYIPDPSEE